MGDARLDAETVGDEVPAAVGGAGVVGLSMDGADAAGPAGGVAVGGVGSGAVPAGHAGPVTAPAPGGVAVRSFLGDDTRGVCVVSCLVGSADDRGSPEDAVVHTASTPAVASMPATTSRRIVAARIAPP